MRILLLHQYFLEENGAGGARWNEICELWAKENHDITVLSGMLHANACEKQPEYKRKLFKRKKHGTIEVIRCHVSESYNSSFMGRLWAYFSFVFSSLWAGLFMARGKFDVVVITSPPLFIGISGYLISFFKRIPFVFEVRDLWPESAIDTGVVQSQFFIKLAYKLEAFFYKKSLLINTLTPAFKKILIEKKNISPHKIICIPNAADFTTTDRLISSFDRIDFRKKLDIDNNFVITYVGAHGLANNLEQILEASKLLEDTNVLFLLIGQGMEKERLKQKALETKTTNVRFIDPLPKEEVYKYILASDMGTSVLKKIETFKTVYSNKTFDYMSCKTPILMAIDGVSRELVEEANAGIFVNPENPDDFAKKVRMYLKYPELVREQGENGYQFAKEHFDRKVLSDNYLIHLQKTIQGNHV